MEGNVRWKEYGGIGGLRQQGPATERRLRVEEIACQRPSSDQLLYARCTGSRLAGMEGDKILDAQL